jgi:hypothetical protein
MKIFVSCLMSAVLCSTPLVAQEPLRYQIKPDQVVPYSVKIDAETPAGMETLSGIIAIKGRELQADAITVEYSGGLSKTVKAKGGSGGRGPRGFGPGGFGRPGGGIPRSPFDRPDFRGLTNTTSEMVVTPTGGVKTMRGDSQLPYLLGNLSLFPFDLLPEGNTTEWADGNGLTITTRSDSDSRFGPRFGPFAGNDNDETVKTGGSESANYRIVSTNGDLVSIAKTYKMTSPSAGGDDPGFNSEGSGTWVFNKAEGVSESMDFKTQLTVAMTNAEVRIPVSVNWKRIPVPEYEAHIKERQEKLAALQAEAKARGEKAAKEAKEKEGKQLPAKVKREILDDLNSKDWVTISRRLDTMKGYVPHPKDFDIAARVKELTSHKVLSVTFSAKEVWKKMEPVIAAADEAAAAELSSEDNPFATDEEKMAADPRDVREWSDSSGSFKVEASFVRLEDKTAVLKRKDGKEVKVPLSRLSPEDRELAESFAKK